MKSFFNFLFESKENGVVFAFGRMQPPTIGHGLLVKKVVDLAKQKKCDHLVVLSRTRDKKSNPLRTEDKVKWARKMFPGVHIESAGPTTPTLIDTVKMLNKKYKILYLVAGSDRVPEYKKLLDKYNGTEYHFDKIEVISAGERDPDADGASGMSATKMRVAAKENDLGKFQQGLPPHMRLDAAKMIDDIRKGMGIVDKQPERDISDFL